MRCLGALQLVLDNNKITKLSSQIKKLRSLKYLSLENNDLAYLPDELGDLHQPVESGWFHGVHPDTRNDA